MSFGFAVGDFLAVGQLVFQLREAYRTAPAEYQSVVTNLDIFNGLLEQIKRDEADPTSALGRCTPEQRRRLGNILQSVEKVLTDLEKICIRYQSGDGRLHVWNRVTFPRRDVKFLQAQLQLHVSATKLFWDSLTTETLGRIVQIVQELAAGQSRQAQSNWAVLLEVLRGRDIVVILKERGISDAAIAPHREELQELVQAANDVAESERDLSPDSTLRSSSGSTDSSLAGTSIFGDELNESEPELFAVGPPSPAHIKSHVCRGALRLQEGLGTQAQGIRQSRQFFTLFGSSKYKLRCRFCQFVGFQDEKLTDLTKPDNTPLFFAARQKPLSPTSLEYHLEIHTQNRRQHDGIFYRSIFFWKCHVTAPTETRHNEGSYECPFCPFENSAGLLYNRAELLGHILDNHVQKQPSEAMRKKFNCWIEDSPALFESLYRNLRGKSFDILLPRPHTERERIVARVARDGKRLHSETDGSESEWPL